MYTLSAKLGRCLDALLSPRCWLCGLSASGSLDLCELCFEELPWLAKDRCPKCAIPSVGGAICGRCLRFPGPVRATSAALLYVGDVRDLVHAFKFGNDLVAGRVLCQALSQVVRTHYRNRPLIPVPSTDGRLRQRGFDPASEIVRTLCRQSSTYSLDDRLRRVDSGAPQSTMADRQRRLANVTGVFHVKPGSTQQRSAVLVDDVLTTGATSNSAARALIAAGVETVDLWACVRTP